MAEEGENAQDAASKTEEPTEHRLREALEKGQLPLSKDLNGWAVLLGLWIVLSLGIPWLGKDLALKLSFFLSQTHQVVLKAPEAHALVRIIGGPFSWALLIGLGIPFMMVLGVGLIQTQGKLSTKNLMPRWERLSLKKNIQKIVGAAAWLEFLKTFLKFLLVALICVFLMYTQIPHYIALPHMPVVGAMGMLHHQVTVLVMVVVLVMGVMAAGDLLYQRFQWRRNLRMSHQDLRDEFKQTEGDPLIKGKIKSLRQEKARQRMMTSVPEATVVVMNPTHYAVALRYDPEKMEAPYVVAKGMDFLALTIRDVAERHHVPIVRDAPLARALYQDVPLDQAIPEKHYQAVATLIRWVMNLERVDK